ncbi:MAG: Thymidylate kinase (EC [uncultured Sulfurovum sp.]|uniref:Thymidylate kinase (EC) n=1 Tax=uncultured Sulfurovum sp. TaxID=269237 RepID=A0A6S6TVN3_9BACT|nr:MAG: Thymidylate kinase (EC [uncultured Sulfurovum sp.]
MRKLLLIIVVILSLFLLYKYGSTVESKSTELNWEHNYKNALLRAKKENKEVYLFIGADSCIHCDRFKEQTLSDEELIETMKEDYVLLYMSRDRHNIPDGFKKYGVPMHYFLTADGNITAHIVGSRELAGWYDVLDEIDLINE